MRPLGWLEYNLTGILIRIGNQRKSEEICTHKRDTREVYAQTKDM